MNDFLPARILPRTGLRLLSLNLAHGRKNGTHQALQRARRIRANLDEIITLLRHREPDFVALQEADGPSLWSGSFNHVEYLAAGANFPHHFRGEHVRMAKLSYGTALLSTHPLHDSRSHRFSATPPMLPKGFVLTNASVSGSPELFIDLVSVHLDFARKSVRLRQCEELIEHLQHRPYPRIIMGDFNCEWWSSEQTLRRISHKLDVHPFQPDDRDLITFPATRRRIDWILCSSGFTFVHHEVLPDRLSDHRPVLAEIEYRPE